MKSKDQSLVSFSEKVNLDSCYRLTLIPVSLHILGVFPFRRLSLVEYLSTQGLLTLVVGGEPVVEKFVVHPWAG